jgi:hypothetical protein
VLVIIFMLLRLMMMVLRAIPMAMRVVVLPGSRALRRISISAVPVAELVVKKPSCYPVRAITLTKCMHAANKKTANVISTPDKSAASGFPTSRVRLLYTVLNRKTLCLNRYGSIFRFGSGTG